MVEEMYQQEMQDEVQPVEAEPQSRAPMHNTGAALTPLSRRVKILPHHATENDPSQNTIISRHRKKEVAAADAPPPEYRGFTMDPDADADEAEMHANSGTQAGEVSLTLGLKHSENVPRMSRLSIRDFEAY